MHIRRYFIIIFMAAVLLLPLYYAQAVTLTVTQQIESLMAQIRYLQSLLAVLQQEQSPQSPQAYQPPQLVGQSQPLLAQPQHVSAASYMVVDMANGRVVAEKNSTKEYPIASITKLMNAVIVKERLPQEAKITLTQEMLQPFGYSPALFLGATVAVQDLLKASLIQSTNDAAQSLTSPIGSESFVKLMNEKAADLGMGNTHFYDAHGLNPANHATAGDLAKLLMYVHEKHPDLLLVSKNNNFWLPGPTGKMLKFQNVNNFHSHPQFVGGKTGYLPEAKQTFAAVFQIHGKPMGVVVLYSQNRQADTSSLINAIQK